MRKEKPFLSRVQQANGVAMVEAAIVLPVLIFIFLVFWDQVSGALLRSHANLARISLQMTFRKSPQQYVVDAAGFRIDVQPLAGSPLRTYIDDAHDSLILSLRNAGSLSDPLANAALELYYFPVDETTGFAESGLRGGPLLASPAFFTGPAAVANDCFGPPGTSEYVELRRRFDAYRTETFSQIQGFQSLPQPLRFGELRIDTNFDGIRTLLYARQRAVLFLMTCAHRPVSFLQSEAVTTIHVFMADKEIEWTI